MLARRLLVLTTVLLALVLFASALTPERTVAPPAARSALPQGGTVTESIPADGTDARVRVNRGDVLELEIAGDTLDSVLLERLDRMDGIEPGTPARFSLLIEAPPGLYPIRLVEADRRVGAIEISG